MYPTYWMHGTYFIPVYTPLKNVTEKGVVSTRNRNIFDPVTKFYGPVKGTCPGGWEMLL